VVTHTMMKSTMAAMQIKKNPHPIITKNMYKRKSNILISLVFYYVVKKRGREPRNPRKGTEAAHPPSRSELYAADTRATSVKPRLLRARKKV